ncbi:hypothetical protein POM88_018800 [Heracleum sosnowskyi]|uniref:Uncharacterized protein n=1 Tax=Heracleum sosnowskyi TaxID=360622 RepID=A0AAD8IR71_9APIA|nr:hypothetical protein POM88_018800 [Heracleum sosnowskyi]
MAKTLVSLLLIFVLSISVFQVNGCSVDAVGGGCPDLTACEQTCGGCYRGIGKVIASCEAPGAGVYWWICHCYFEDGAPCPPVGGPKCPDPPALATHAPLVHPPAPAVKDIIV